MKADPEKTIALLREIADYPDIWWGGISGDDDRLPSIPILFDLKLIKSNKENVAQARLTARGQKTVEWMDYQWSFYKKESTQDRNKQTEESIDFAANYLEHFTRNCWDYVLSWAHDYR